MTVVNPLKIGDSRFQKIKVVKILKMPQVLTNDLKMMKNEVEKIPGFNDNFFIVGGMLPVCSNTLTNNKNDNCKLANVKQI